MQKQQDKIWDNQNSQQLIGVLSELKNINDLQDFLRDVMTEKEIVEIGSRLEAARLLNSGAKYNFVSETTKLSSRTIARISEWMKNGNDGYKKAIEIINKNHSHILPDRADV